MLEVFDDRLTKGTHTTRKAKLMNNPRCRFWAAVVVFFSLHSTPGIFQTRSDVMSLYRISPEWCASRSSTFDYMLLFGLNQLRRQSKNFVMVFKYTLVWSMTIILAANHHSLWFFTYYRLIEYYEREWVPSLAKETETEGTNRIFIGTFFTFLQRLRWVPSPRIAHNSKNECKCAMTKLNVLSRINIPRWINSNLSAAILCLI